MEQVTIMSDNPRMSLREHKELIEQVLGKEKRSTGMDRSKTDMIPNFTIEALGWK